MQAMAIARIAEKNGGDLPSDLYLQTNAELAKLVYDLSGKQPSRTASKESLVKRVERLTAKQQDQLGKRKTDDKENGTAGKKRKTGAEATPGQMAEMKRVLSASAEDLESRSTHAELQKIWNRMGYTAQYPHRSSKASVISRLQKYAQKHS